ncbi:uncharacterized protein METZ01_LOCUS390396, partial [marine metagenome]
MAPYLDHVYGNPSSLHRFGQQARKAVDEAREQVAHLVGSDPDEIFFTSGGTEADNWAVNGAAAALEGRVVTTAIEHHAVLHSAEALRHQQREVVIAGVDGRGLVDPESLVSLAGS